MLDPDLIDQLAAQPEKNAPGVNLALAEQGEGRVLLSLARSAAVAGDALAVIARRVEQEGDALDQDDADDDDDDDDEPAAVAELDRLLIAHPNSPDAVRDQLLAKHHGEPWFVLAAASHPRATLEAVRHAAKWPRRSLAFDCRWLSLIAPEALPPLVAEAWAQDPDVQLRVAAATLSHDTTLLEQLSRDAAREVRRAVASNVHAVAQRQRLADDDVAAEVRARASAARTEHDTGPHGADSARFAAALRAMEARGALAPDVAAALASPHIDPEGALCAAQVLPHAALVGVVREAASRAIDVSALAVAAGIALRPLDDDARELVAEAVQALSGASAIYGALTGKARFAAWLGDGLARSEHIDRDALASVACHGALAGEPEVLARGARGAPPLLHGLCACGGEVPPALLEIAWRSLDLSDDDVLALANRVASAKRRGRELSDDEIDLDPNLRNLETLERCVLAVGRKVTVAPRAALAVVALDSRRVRYVLTALPSWRGPLNGTMLGRVLKQRAGALSAARSETRSRQAEVRDWTERMLSDTEVAVALAVGHFTAAALADRLEIGRHTLVDGRGVASGAEARAVLEGSESIKPLIRYANKHRGHDAAALALWLLLERHDRERSHGMIASAVDSLVQRHASVADTLCDALAALERRSPGRLEVIVAHTPRGKATIASALARAYRAVGGLRAER